MRWQIGLSVALAALALAVPPAAAQDSGSKADAERDIQAYLAMWSSDGHFDAGTVARFYAPRVVYYGKTFSRAQVLGDKLAYIRHWPVRRYTEVPGSFRAHCDAARTICKVSVVMRWYRESTAHQVSTGRARLRFDFVPVDGGRKIARESASILDGRR